MTKRFQFKFSFLFTVLVFVLSSSLTLAIILSWHSYSKARQAAVATGRHLLEQIESTALSEWNSAMSEPARLLLQLPRIPYITEQPTSTKHPAQSILFNILESHNEIHEIYVKWNDGAEYRLAELSENHDTFNRSFIPEDTKYFAEFIRPSRESTITWIKSTGQQIGLSINNVSTHDHQDLENNNSSETKTAGADLVSASKKQTAHISSTYEVPFSLNGGGVFGVDIKFDSLVHFIDSQTPGPEGHILIFEPTGNIVARSRHREHRAEFVHHPPGRHTTTMADEEDFVLSALYNKYKSENYNFGEAFPIEIESIPYLAIFSEVSSTEENNILAVFAPEEYFTAEAITIRNQCLTISAAIMFFTMIAIIYYSKKISIPLQSLANDARNIQQFNLDYSGKSNSRITEIDELAVAMQNIRQAIKTFTQFVPRSLVKLYITTGKPPRIGGDRRPLTIMFTDLEGFTPLTESTEPESIVYMLSDYFTLLSDKVTQSDGTVDKYIGDSMMAFWNAPNFVEHHASAGCESALQCAHAVKDYRYHCPVTDKVSSLKTRFGLHYGEAVVSTIGSADRINYTAMGSAVNIASRLEQLNKYYGTTILVSREVKELSAQSFVFRTVDRALIKGLKTPTTIYELVGSKPILGSPSIEVSNERMAYLDKWESVYSMYREREWEKALLALETMDTDDPLVAIYTRRIRDLLDNDPGENWDGVIVMNRR